MQTYEIVRDIRNQLTDIGWRFKYDEEGKLFHLGFNVESKIKSVDIFVQVNDESFNVYAICPISADEDCRNEVMRYVTLANMGLRNGNFELNLRNGEVQYKVFVHCKDFVHLERFTVGNPIHLSVQMWERYGNGLAALCMGFSDADSEIKKAESDLR